MQLLQPDKESCRSEILHARVYGLDLSKGIARAETFFVSLKKTRDQTDGGQTLVAYSILLSMPSPTPVSYTCVQHPLKLTHLQKESMCTNTPSSLKQLFNGTPFKFLTLTQ